MQTHLRPVLDEVWSQHRSDLAEAIRESLRELANVLRLDDYRKWCVFVRNAG